MRLTTPQDGAGNCPQVYLVGLVRIELTTSALSVLRSNRLSYSPMQKGNPTPPSPDRSAQPPGQRRIDSDWLAVASRVPDSDHMKAIPWA